MLRWPLRCGVLARRRCLWHHRTDARIASHIGRRAIIQLCKYTCARHATVHGVKDTAMCLLIL